jgi:chromosome segregation ATPase
VDEKLVTLREQAAAPGPSDEVVTLRGRVAQLEGLLESQQTKYNQLLDQRRREIVMLRQRLDKLEKLKLELKDSKLKDLRAEIKHLSEQRDDLLRKVFELKYQRGATSGVASDDANKLRKQLMKKYHPDANSNPAATEMAQDINELFDACMGRNNGRRR